MGAETPTKGISRIYVGDNLMDQLVREERKKRLIDLFEAVKEKFYEVTDSMWVKIENKDVYYVDKYRMLIADTTRKECPRDRFNPKFAGYTGRLLTQDEAYDLFFETKRENPLIDDSDGAIVNCEDKVFYVSYNGYLNQIRAMHVRDKCIYCWGAGDTRYVKIPVYDCDKSVSKFQCFIHENLMPSAFKEDDAKLFQCLMTLNKEQRLTLSTDDLCIFGESFMDNSFVSGVLSGEYDTLNNTTFRKEDIIEFLKSQKQQLTAIGHFYAVSSCR